MAIPLVAAGLLGPWLGAVADAGGHRRAMLAGATLICATASALLVTLGPGDIVAGMLLFIAAQLACLLATALYNSYLPEISTPQTSARISGMAWGLSYLGGIACFLLCLPFIRAGVVADNEAHFANAFLVTAGFLLTFGMISILGLPAEDKVDGKGEKANPYQRLWNTVRSWRQERQIPKFLLAYYLINDAMVTVLYFTAPPPGRRAGRGPPPPPAPRAPRPPPPPPAGRRGAGAGRGRGSDFLKATFGLSMQEILILSLTFQMIAIPSTIFFGWLGDRWSQFGAVNVTLVIWVLVLALMGLAEGEHAPPVIAIALGLVLGSTQSLLRSMYSQMVPPDRAGEYFGFHALACRASSALGPLLFGAVSAVAGSQRIAMMSLGVFLLAGAILLARVQAEIR
ncbi:MAG: MFS transporter [Candidatus Accumulibacter sp.]|uniref:MFS transporter n=1 Tax=Candidatus Accumulibacter affinis TaxID=2954384 RepID=A0A935W3X1_9PROT|nr:MFS transporter [Candidatus Accumulibacter affinis]